MDGDVRRGADNGHDAAVVHGEDLLVAAAPRHGQVVRAREDVQIEIDRDLSGVRQRERVLLDIFVEERDRHRLNDRGGAGFGRRDGRGAGCRQVGRAVDDLAAGVIRHGRAVAGAGAGVLPSARDEHDDGENHGDEKNAAEDELPADIGAGAAGSGGVRRGGCGRMRYAVRLILPGRAQFGQRLRSPEYFWPQRRQVVSGMKPIRMTSFV